MSQDLTHYTRAYYQRDIAETWFWRHGLLRPDQLAALCYTLGWPFLGLDGNPRDPGHVVSIGAGRGELEAQLEKMGHQVTGVDPSQGAADMYEGSTLAPEATRELVAGAGTVIWCESIEHIPAEQTMRVRSWMTAGTRGVVVNWPDYYPLLPDGTGWDHISRVDDDFYRKLAGDGRTVLRWKSHLVFEVGL